MVRFSLILAFLVGVIWAKPVVSASILPTAFFVEQIGASSVEVNTIVQEFADPHSFEPRASDMKKLENSNLFFAVGIEYEDVWLPKFSKAFPNLKVIKTQGKTPKYDKITHDDHHEHGDHKHEEHKHEFDTHIWLDPIMVKEQSKIIANALSQKYPQNSELYSQNLDKFNQEIDKLDSYIKDSLKDLKNRKFMVFHPSWGYFAKRYNLTQIAIESGGKEPKPAALAKLIKMAKSENIKVIFISPEFSQKSAKLIAEQTGAKLIEINHLSKNWLENMYTIADIFKKFAMNIEITNLSFGYDDGNIFKNLNFSYHSRDFLAIIGPNGGGKSTLLKLMLGILEPQSGKISIDSKPPKLAKELIGYVPQYIPVNKTFPMSVLEVVLMGRLRSGLFKFYSKADKNMAMQALKMVGMQDFSTRGIGALSGGQRQRVYIARALVSGARILMLDEPTASIDTQGQAQIYSVLKEINQSNVGVIAISHDINMAMNFATKVAYVNSGSVVLHDISNLDNREFINHLSKSHTHFCDVELALNSCGCASHKE